MSYIIFKTQYSRSWWWTGRPGELWFMGSQTHDWVTELNWTEQTIDIGASQVVLVVNHPTANAGDLRHAGSILRLGRSSGGGHGNPLQ